MQKFKDAENREWQIAITIGSVDAVFEAIGVDLLQPDVPQGTSNDPLLTQLGTDERLLGQVICELLMEQIDAANMDVKDIKAAFDGKTMLAATAAFHKEWAHFFRERGRTDRVTMIEKQAVLMGRGVERARELIEEVDVDEIVRSTMPGNSPVSSE